MSGSSFVPKTFSKVLGYFEERNKIKSRHIRNLRRLRNDSEVILDFSDLERYTLGSWAATKHDQVVDNIRTSGVLTEGDSYEIPERSDREEIEQLTQSAVRRIRIKNTVSFFWWLSLIIVLIAAPLIVGRILNSVPSSITLIFFDTSLVTNRWLHELPYSDWTHWAL